MFRTLGLAVVCFTVVTAPSFAEPEKDGKTLTEWRKQLKAGKSPEERYKAAIAIGQMADEAKAAVEDLVAALNDKNWEVRQYAVNAIGSIGDALEGKGPEMEKAFPTVAAALKDAKAPDSDNYVLREVLHTLPLMVAKTPDAAKKVVPLLTPYLAHKDPSVREEAVRDLTSYLQETKLTDHIKAVTPEFVKLLKDANPGVRDLAKDGIIALDPATAKKLGLE
jgi:HEAT repeat protein